MTNKKKFEINHWLHITDSSSSPVPGEDPQDGGVNPKQKQLSPRHKI